MILFLSVVAHEVFGVASTINAANYVYFLALEKVCLGVNCSRSAAVSNDDALDVFIRELISLHHGQVRLGGGNDARVWTFTGATTSSARRKTSTSR